MDAITPIYESCYNEIILHNFPGALQSFLTAYREHPRHTPFLHGVIISYLLLKEIENLAAFLEKEKEVSPLRGVIEPVYFFFIDNNMVRKKQTNIFYNTALFIKKEISLKEARAYFSIGQIIYPSNRKYLVAMAEYYMREGNYTKGLKLYSQAAGAEKNGL